MAGFGHGEVIEAEVIRLGGREDLAIMDEGDARALDYGSEGIFHDAVEG